MRALNRIAAALLGLILLAAGLVIIIQTVSALVGTGWPIPPSWRTRLAQTPVSDWRVFLVSVIVGVVGLLLLIGQLLPRRPQRLPAMVAGRTWWVSRRSVERRAARAASDAGTAGQPKVTARGNPNRWQVRLTGDAAPHRRDEVERSVRDELHTVGAPDTVDLQLALRQPRRVA